MERQGDIWVAVIEAGRDPATGKRRRHIYRCGERKRDAEKKLREKLAELDAGTYAAPSKQTVAQFLGDWLNGTARMRVSARTWEAYRGWIDGHLIPHLGRHRLDQLTPAPIQAAWALLLAAGRRDGKGGLSPKSVQHCHGVLRTALQTAVRQGLITRNPCDLVDLPRQRKPELEVLDAAQINALLDAARGSRLYMVILLAVTTGMRRGEILALRWRDVDLEAGVLTVCRATEQTKTFGVRMKETKSGKSRKIDLPDLLATELRRHRDVTGRVQGLIICNEDGSPWTPDLCSYHFRLLMKRTPDLPRVRLHDLRHSAATLLLSLGIELAMVSEILGHCDPSVTARIYAHVLPSARKQAAERMDEALKRAGGG